MDAGHIAQLIVSAAVGAVVSNVIAFFVMRMLKRMVNANALRDRKQDCLIYAVQNVNGDWSGLGKAIREKYIEEMERLESEDKVKYRP